MIDRISEAERASLACSADRGARERVSGAEQEKELAVAENEQTACSSQRVIYPLCAVVHQEVALPATQSTGDRSFMETRLSFWRSDQLFVLLRLLKTCRMAIA